MVFSVAPSIFEMRVGPGIFVAYGTGQCSGSNSIIDPVWNLLLQKCCCPQNGVGVFFVHHPQPPINNLNKR